MTFRSTAALAAATLSAAALLAAPAATAHADTTLPVGTPQLHSLGISGTVSDMTPAAGKIWVSTGNEVDVFSTAGKKLAAITGLMGASGLVASADGTSVYVAAEQDSQIDVLDTASMTKTASWTTSPCPTDLALAGGRLFYSFSCTVGSGSVGSVSLADGSAGPVIADSFYSQPRLAGAGSNLVAVGQVSAPAPLDSYAVAADGSATQQATTTVAEPYDLGISPDGSEAIVTGYDSGYTIERFHTADLSPAGTLPMGYYPKAVAYSPDGSSLAGAVTTNPTDMLRVFDGSSGTLTSRSSVVLAGQDTPPDVISGTLHYSADGTLLYAVAEVDGVANLVTATTGPVVSTGIAATVTSPKTYGAKGSVRVLAPGRPHTAVTVTLAGPTGTRTYHGTTNSAGTVVVKLSSSYNATVTVTVPGDLTHAAHTVTRGLHVPAELKVGAARYYSSKGGLLHYHTPKSVDIPVQAFPRRSVVIESVLEAKVGGTWYAVTEQNFTLSSTGSAYFIMTSARKHVPYRFAFEFPGDTYNTKSHTVTSKAVVID